jgi:hypothetical protein
VASVRANQPTASRASARAAAASPCAASSNGRPGHHLARGGAALRRIAQRVARHAHGRVGLPERGERRGLEQDRAGEVRVRLARSARDRELLPVLAEQVMRERRDGVVGVGVAEEAAGGGHPREHGERLARPVRLHGVDREREQHLGAGRDLRRAPHRGERAGVVAPTARQHAVQQQPVGRRQPISPRGHERPDGVHRRAPAEHAPHERGPQLRQDEAVSTRDACSKCPIAASKSFAVAASMPRTKRS